MKTKKPTKKPVVDLLAKEVVSGMMFNLDRIKLPRNKIVDVYYRMDESDKSTIVGKAKVAVKYGKLIAQIEEMDDSLYGYYLRPNIKHLSSEDFPDFELITKSELINLYLDEYPSKGQTSLTIKEQIQLKNHIQDFFGVDEILRLCKLYNVSCLEISDYTGIQYNSIYQYIGNGKTKPILPLSKVVKAAIYLYFKAVFNHNY